MKKRKNSLIVLVLLGIMLIIPEVVSAQEEYVTLGYDAYVRQGEKRIPEAFNDAYCRFKVLYYEGTYNRTYFTYGDVNSNPMITYFDNDTMQSADPVQIAATPITNDAHAHPSMVIDSEGYLYVFYGSHNSNQWMIRSSNPEDISSWDNPRILSGVLTYPETFIIGDTMYCLYRQRVTLPGNFLDHKWGYRTSTDYQTNWTWSDETILVDASPMIGAYDKFAYPIICLGNESPIPKIHMSFIVYDPLIPPTLWRDVYYTYSDDAMLSWKKSDGSTISLPLTEYNTEQILDYDYTHGWINDIQVDSNNQPYILFLEGNDGSVENILKIAKYENNAWEVRTITDTPNSRYNSGCLRIEPDGTIKVYAAIGGDPNGNGPGDYGGEIQEFTSTDNCETWTKTLDITQNSSPLLHNFPLTALNSWNYRPVTNDKIHVAWCSGLNEPGQIHAWGPGLNVSTDDHDIPASNNIWLSNYPNPFNPVTTISYSLPKSCEVTLNIYNIKGELVEILINTEQQAGEHSIVWNAEDVSSGIYFYQIKTDESVKTKKCVIMK